MFGALIIGIGIGVVYLTNQGVTGETPPPAHSFLQQENGSYLLQENGSKIIIT